MVLSMKAVRVNAGYTQKEASELLGVSQPTLHRIEKEGLNNVRVDLLVKMLELYHVSLSDIGMDFYAQKDENKSV